MARTPQHSISYCQQSSSQTPPKGLSENRAQPTFNEDWFHSNRRSPNGQRPKHTRAPAYIPTRCHTHRPLGFRKTWRVNTVNHHPSIFIRRKDVSFNADMTHATLKVRLAKTAAPGESQYLRLAKQPNVLDTISAITSILNTLDGDPEDPLFPGKDITVPIQRITVITHIKSFKPPRNASWSGQSLCIGGASLKAHCGNSVKLIQRAGIWKSSCYKLYLRKYDNKTASETALLARSLNCK